MEINNEKINYYSCNTKYFFAFACSGISLFNGEKLLEAAMEWEKYQASSRQADLMIVAEYAGYIGAMFDHLSEKQHICAVEGTTKNDVIKVVTDFLKAKNKGLNLSGSVIIEDALYRYYMCK